MTTRPTPEALDRALQLLQEPPEKPSTPAGYLDLLGDQDAPESSGAIQNLWLSQPGSQLYDGLLRLSFGVNERVRPVLGGLEFLDVPGRLQLRGGETVLDLGSGPGNITRSLARAVGETGLVLGADVSPAMLARAVNATDAEQVVYLRADASRPPLEDDSVDAVCCSACLQLLADPFAALSEMQRVLRPGGRLALSAPGAIGPLDKAVQFAERAGGVRLFRSGELQEALRTRGFEQIRERGPLGMRLADAVKPG
jgi:SAM-dependent methyltransferase